MYYTYWLMWELNQGFVLRICFNDKMIRQDLFVSEENDNEPFTLTTLSHIFIYKTASRSADPEALRFYRPII